MMCKNKRVGIMGGTFNPVHMAHLILAENAYRAFDLDEVMFLPNGDPPHKTDLIITPASDRVAMLEAAVKDIPYFRVDDMEIKRQGLSYTSDTLQDLNRCHPDKEYYFIMGADSVFQIESWHEPMTVMNNCIILAAIRDQVSQEDFDKQIEYLKEKYHADIRKMDIPDLEISSSNLRERVSEGKPIRFMVPDSVDAYIRDHGLYRHHDEKKHGIHGHM